MGLFRPDPPVTRARDREVVNRRLAQLSAPPADPDDGPARHPSGQHRAPALPGPARATGAVADQLPPSVRRRVVDRGVTGQHVAVVGLMVAALVTGAAWWVLDGRPETRVVVPPQPVAPSGAPLTPPVDAGADPLVTTAAPAEGTVIVDVTGRVRRSGLVTLPAGSRVADALDSAGGARPGVDLSSLNLARMLVDGEQILVGQQGTGLPAAAPTDPAAVPGVPVAPVDLNTATMVELETLPDVGPVTAQSILDWRAANGGFTSVDELLEVDGIGEVTLANLRDLVTV